ncbi:MAG: DUF2169 domain-containing protein [Polyangiaceae bacterium]
MAIEVAAARGIAARALLWKKAGGGPEVFTVVAKVSFLLREGAPAWTPSEPLQPWSAADAAQTDDLVPFRPRADVVVTGSTLGQMTTVLAYARGAAGLLHKTARPSRAPLGDLAPLSRASAPRAARLRAHDPTRLTGDAIVVPADLDPAFFQSAADDQQVDAIHERDVVRVMGDAPRRWVIEWWIPHVRIEAHARVVGGASSTCVLRPDGLRLDLDRQIASLVLRGQLAAPEAGAPTSLAIGASLTSAAVAWPHFHEPRPRPAIVEPAARPSSVVPSPAGTPGTMLFSASDVEEARRLAAQHGFVPGKRREMPAPPPAPPPPSPSRFPEPPVAGAPDIAGTLLQSDLEIAKVAAQLATPFERQSALPPQFEPSVPPPHERRGTPPATPFERQSALPPLFDRPSAIPVAPTFGERSPDSTLPVPTSPLGEGSGTMFSFEGHLPSDRASSLPFVPGSAAPPARSTASDAQPAEPSGTMMFDDAFLAKLHAGRATPFDAEGTPAPFTSPAAPAPREVPFTAAVASSPSEEQIRAAASSFDEPEQPQKSGDPFGTMVFGGDHMSLIEAALSMPFRQATEEDVPFQIPSAFAARERGPNDDISGTMFTLSKSVPKARVARVIPFRPQRTSAKLEAAENRARLGEIFLEVLGRL